MDKFMQQRTCRFTRRGVMGGAAAMATAIAARPLFAQQNSEAAAGTRVVLLGTQGGPTVNLHRAQTASAVTVDGVSYLVDCGYGTVRRLVAAGIGYLDIENVFLTHLHDDHMIDIAALLSLQWTGSANHETTVHGPVGTEAMVAGAIDFFQANVDIRTADEGRTVDPRSVFHGQDIPAASEPREVFRDERVRISTVENTHYPEFAKAEAATRSISHRFDTADRSIVFSGDTAYSENLIALAKGADIFVCEAMDIETQRGYLDRAAAEGSGGEDEKSIWRHVAETHVTTEQVGQMAAAAGVKMVVLYHLLPGSNGTPLPETTYIEGVRKAYDGPVIVGRDLMVL